MLRFIERVEQQFDGKNRPFVECVSKAFDVKPWDFRCAEIQYAQLRHVETATRFVERSDETPEAQKVYIAALRGIGDTVGPKHGHQGWHEAKQALDRDRNHLVLLNSRMLSSNSSITFDNDQIDDLEKRLNSALQDFDSAGANDALVGRFKDVVAALLFGLRNMEFLGPDVAWERASALVMVVATAPSSLASEKHNSPLKRLAAAGVAALAMLHATRIASDDALALVSNIEEIGAHVIEWQERPMIEDKRTNEIRGRGKHESASETDAASD